MGPYSQKQRYDALKRAQKLEVLFKGGLFDDILDASEGKNKMAFTNACKRANLNDSEIAWLWNYLKECDKNFWMPLPSASSTGW